MSRSSYLMYGATIASDLPLRAPRTSSPANLSIAVTDEPADLTGAVLLFHGSGRGRSADGFVYRRDAALIVIMEGLATFTMDADTITVLRAPTATEHEVELLLVGTILPLLVDMNGGLALHGAVIEIGGASVALLARKGGGKSSMAAALMARGARLVSDDVAIPIRAGDGFGMASGQPWLKLSPEVAHLFLERTDELERVAPVTTKLYVGAEAGCFSGFAVGTYPLSAVYILNRLAGRHPGELRVGPLSPSRAVGALLENMTLARLGEILGLAEERLKTVAALASSVAIATLDYPSGLVGLDGVAVGVVADIEARTTGLREALPPGPHR